MPRIRASTRVVTPDRWLRMLGEHVPNKKSGWLTHTRRIRICAWKRLESYG
jgi:hypothetical protein